jgi:Protein phosphatase 2C
MPRRSIEAFLPWRRVKEAQPSAPNEIALDRIVAGSPAAAFEARALDTITHKQQPFRPDTIVDAWSTEEFNVRAACVRGDSHRYHGDPRQDELALAHHAKTGSVVVAVADGVGSVAEAEVGATTACRYAIRHVLRALHEERTVDWSSLIHEAAWGLVHLARQGGDEDTTLDQAESMYATTLTVALVRPISPSITNVSGVGVGDTALWILCEDKLARLLGGKAPTEEDALFSSAVAALPRAPDRVEITDRNVDSKAVILVISDGIGDALGDGSGSVGDLLRSQLRLPPSLLHFARVTDFSRDASVDDRSLVAVWRRSTTEQQ